MAAASCKRRRGGGALSSRDMNEMGNRSNSLVKPKMSGTENEALCTGKRVYSNNGSTAAGNERSSFVSESSLVDTHFQRSKAPSTTSGWSTAIWRVHFLLALVILSIGIVNNKDASKYLPINPTLAGDQCTRAYLNVRAQSESDANAVVCCSANSTVNRRPFALFLEHDVCTSKSESLPLANRLSKFPEAWLLPLFPVLVRVAYWISLLLSTRSSDPLFVSVSIANTLKRLCLYVALLTFRGWVLYVYLNRIEDHFSSLSKTDYATTSSTTTAAAGTAGDTATVDMATCWYNDGWLQVGQETCVGRAFDFSDHIVLYYAQILPIALVETIYAFQYPYWKVAAHQTAIVQILVPLVLGVSQVYLQLITATGAYTTAAFFHTPGEIWAGFVVSLVIAAPLCLLQCSTHRQAKWWRSHLFGQ